MHRVARLKQAILVLSGGLVLAGAVQAEGAAQATAATSASPNVALRGRARPASLSATPDSPNQGAPRSPGPTSVTQNPALNEVMVTAQRVSQPVETVPISITVLSSRELTAFNINSTQDLQGSVPGLEFTQNATAGSIYIRGVGNDNPFPDESAVAIYVDGIYRPESSADMFSLDNVQDVQVLMGPQGTLFGRNATGGVILINTRDPTSEPGGDVEVGYGNYGTYRGNMYFTTGITRDLSANVSGYYEDQSQGWGTDVYNGTPAYRNRDEALMSKWKLDLPNTTITLIGDVDREDTSNGFAGAVIGPSPYTGLPLFAGYYNINVDDNPFFETTQGGIGLIVDHHMDWAEVRYIGSVRKYSTDMNGDQDYTPSNVLDLTWKMDEDDTTDEIQLLSSPQSKIKWIVGGFFLNLLSDIYDFDLYGPGTNTDYLTELHTISFSGYGQVTLPITDNTNVTGGIRYTSDSKSGSGSTIQELPSLSIIPAQVSHTWTAPTWRLEVDHNFTKDLMTYASYNRGFKSGLFNQEPLNILPVAPETVDAYEVGSKWRVPNHAVTFNFDVFYELFNNIQVQDIVSIPAPENLIINAAKATVKGLDVQVLANPVDNLELGFNANYSDGVYDKFLNAPAVTPLPNGTYSSGPGQVQDDSGKAMDRMPKWGTVFNAAYTIPVGDAKIVIAAQDSYTSSFYIQPNQQILDPAVNLINASVEWELASGWKLRFWGRNLTDRLSWINVNAFLPGKLLQPAPPRTYGATVGYDF